MCVSDSRVSEQVWVPSVLRIPLSDTTDLHMMGVVPQGSLSAQSCFISFDPKENQKKPFLSIER